MELVAQKRDILGKKVKNLREQGLVPAEVYGGGVENAHIVVSAKEFNKVFKQAGENTIISLSIDGKEQKALIHDVDFDALTEAPIHADFRAIRMDEKLRVHIPVRFTGESAAVKNGGVLVKAMQELEVESLPADLPHEFSVDLSVLVELGNSIHVSDLVVPKGVEILAESEAVIVTVTAQVEEEEVVAAPVDLSEIKTETEEKKAEREAKKAAEEVTEKE